MHQIINNIFGVEMKRFFVLSMVFIALWFKALANESEVSKLPVKKPVVYVNVDFVSSHVWRGGKSGNAPSVEPLLEFNYGNLTLGTWAAATFDQKYKELDLYLSYQVNAFSITLFDYYCPPEKLSEARFSNFHGSDTYHLYSTDVSFNGNQKLPFTFTASTMMYGMDMDPETGKYYFSTYLETGYSKSWNNNSVSTKIGITTHKGIYAEKAALVNTEMSYTKTFEFDRFNLPLFSRLIYNPYSGKAFVVGGFSVNGRISN